MRLHPSREDLAAIAFVLPLAALAGYVAAHKLAEPAAVAVPGGYDLVGPVTHVRDGDTRSVSAASKATGTSVRR
jgi:hypothetical protein